MTLNLAPRLVDNGSGIAVRWSTGSMVHTRDFGRTLTCQADAEAFADPDAQAEWVAMLRRNRGF